MPEWLAIIGALLLTAGLAWVLKRKVRQSRVKSSMYQHKSELEPPPTSIVIDSPPGEPPTSSPHTSSL